VTFENVRVELLEASDRQTPAAVLQLVACEESFWRAKYLKPSVYLEHLPLLFWLIGALRPNRAVTLGTGEGTAHFGLCQAVDRLKIGTACHGLDAAFAADATPPASFVDYNANQYEEFSRLGPIAGRRPVERFGAEAVDLLLSDRVPDGALLDELRVDWLPAMSKSALLFLAGLDQLDPEGTQAFERLCHGRTCLRLGRRGATAIIFAGRPGSARLRQLVEAMRSSEAHGLIEQAFQRLGAGYAAQIHAQERRNAANGMRESREEARAERDCLLRRIESATSQIQMLNEAYDARHGVINRLKAELVDHRAALAEQRALEQQLRMRGEMLEAENAALRASLSQQVDRTVSLELKLAETCDARDTALSEEARLRAELSDRFEELAALTLACAKGKPKGKSSSSKTSASRAAG
jgi:hypothetical protein